jgi:IS5 family transposase
MGYLKDHNKEIKKQKKRINTPEGKLDKNGKPLKFSRDMKSDWTVKNDKPHYGLKEHASVDVNHGFILSTTLTPTSVNGSGFLPYCTLYVYKGGRSF